MIPEIFGWVPAAWVSAGLAGLAAWLFLRASHRPLRRVTVTDGPGLHRLRWERRLAGRPDAAPLARRALTSSVAAAAVTLGVSQLDAGPGALSWVGFPFLAVVTTVGLGWLEPLAARRRREDLLRQVPQALELLAACLAAGMPVRTACAAVSDACDDPVAAELRRVLAVTALGVSDADAWRSLQDHPELGPAAVDLARSVESGTMMVEGLRRHAQAARERRRAGLQVRARAVGVRSVLPLMVCFIPSFMLVGVVPTVVSAVAEAFSR